MIPLEPVGGPKAGVGVALWSVLRVVAVALAIAAPARVLAESHSVALGLHPSTDLSIGYTAVTSDSQLYDIESTFFDATIETDIVPGFGLVATSIRFDSGQTYFTETSLSVQNLFMGVPYDERVNPVDLFANLTSAVRPAAATGPGTSVFDASPLEYTVYEGFVNFSSETFPGVGETYFFDESNLVVPLTGSGSVRLTPNYVSRSAEVVVTLPLDGTGESPWSSFSFAGNLVLTGSLPLPGRALPLPPLLGWATACLLAATGRRALSFGARARPGRLHLHRPADGVRSSTRRSKPPW